MTRTAPGGQEGEGSKRPSPTSRTRRPSSYKKRPIVAAMIIAMTKNAVTRTMTAEKMS